jgi:tetratricopeptide (TPR) repeat protein
VNGGIATVALLVALAGSVLPAEGQQAEWDRFRSDWDTEKDSKAVLSGLAGAAAGIGDLPRFHAFLDSVVGGERPGPNALQYWGAVGLQLGVPPDSVARRFAASLNEGTDAVTVAALVQILEAFDADDAARGFLERAADAGVPGERLALVRGQLLSHSGDREAAVEAWLLAIAAGGDEGVAAAARVGDLVADGREIPAGTVERLAALRAVADGGSAAAIAMLQVRVHAAAGSWSEALEAAADPALGTEARGEALRGVARTAREAGRLEAARGALETLVALGPPGARPEDRLLLGEVEDELGDAVAAAGNFEAARREGVSGAGARELAAGVAAARASGDPERVALALRQAVAAGADPASVAVPRGDLLLSRSRADSALTAYAEGVREGPVGAAGLEALSRVRLAQALVRTGTARPVVAEIGDALVRAPSDPAVASVRFAELAGRLGDGDTLAVARSLVQALSAEWKGRAGDAAGASEALERAAREARSPTEIPALLLDAGRWAQAAGDPERARRLWRAVVEEHASTPYALDARRRLSEGGP